MLWHAIQTHYLHAHLNSPFPCHRADKATFNLLSLTSRGSFTIMWSTVPNGCPCISQAQVTQRTDKDRRTGYWKVHLKLWLSGLRAGLMEKDIAVLYIRDWVTIVQNWWPLAGLVSLWNIAQRLILVPLNTPAVMCVHWMAPFKCMRLSLKASIKKIKGDCCFIFFFFYFETFCQGNISSYTQKEKRNGTL